MPGLFVTAASSALSWLIQPVSLPASRLTRTIRLLLCSPPFSPRASSAPLDLQGVCSPTLLPSQCSYPSPHSTYFNQGEESRDRGDPCWVDTHLRSVLCGQRLGPGGIVTRAALLGPGGPKHPGPHILFALVSSSGLQVEVSCSKLEYAPFKILYKFEGFSHYYFNPPAITVMEYHIDSGKNHFGRRRKYKIKRLSVQINSAQSTIKQHLTFKKYLIHVLASSAA